ASLLLVVYAIGAAIPMLAIAYGGQAVTTRVRRIARIGPRLQQGFGIVVIAFAIASYFQYDTLIVAWLTGFYPNGQIGLRTPPGDLHDPTLARRIRRTGCVQSYRHDPPRHQWRSACAGCSVRGRGGTAGRA